EQPALLWRGCFEVHRRRSNMGEDQRCHVAVLWRDSPGSGGSGRSKYGLRNPVQPNQHDNQWNSRGRLLSLDEWRRNMALKPGTPQTIYMGVTRHDSAGTAPGVYRSTDGGQTWNLVYTAPFANSTSDVRVAVTAADAQKVYVYAGGRDTVGGQLLLRVEVSSDGGGT